MTDVTGASLSYQVHPGHTELVDDVIEWYDGVAAGLERAALPTTAEDFALERWAAHGYQPDVAALGDTGDWTQLNERDLTDVEQPVLSAGFPFRTADEAGPQAAVRAHVDAWAPSAYTAQSYAGVRQTAAYRGDLHVLVEAPDGTMASSTIMWLDEARPGPLTPRSSALGRRGILGRAGCTTASGSGSSRATRRSSRPRPRAENWPAGSRRADAATELLARIAEHLNQEEREVLPLIDRYLTEKEWKKVGGSPSASAAQPFPPFRPRPEN